MSSIQMFWYKPLNLSSTWGDRFAFGEEMQTCNLHVHVQFTAIRINCSFQNVCCAGNFIHNQTYIFLWNFNMQVGHRRASWKSLGWPDNRDTGCSYYLTLHTFVDRPAAYTYYNFSPILPQYTSEQLLLSEQMHYVPSDYIPSLFYCVIHSISCINFCMKMPCKSYTLKQVFIGNPCKK
jgi:hypothetical protein